ncbi:MAG: hypothetical protein LBI60_01665 [Bacteroidales bacterium]|nr:hypothetical protein [Bacteroidales bacterium]
MISIINNKASMKKILGILSLHFILITTCLGQTTDDFGRIALRGEVASVAKLSDETESLLLTKLYQIAADNGIAATDFNPRFVIVAKIDIVGKDIVAGPPQMISHKLKVTLFVGDAVEQKLFGNTEISVTGIGTNETKACINAVNKINPKHPEIKSMLEKSKAKIIAYYAQNCAAILNEAKSLSAQGKYNHAIYNLSLVPDVCSECYQKSLDLQEEIYTKKIETEGKQAFQQAQTLWAQSPNKESASEVMAFVSQINPQVSFIDKVESFVKKVTDVVQEQELRQWKQQIKEYNDLIKLEKERINAYREIAVEYVKNQPREIYNTLIIW